MDGKKYILCTDPVRTYWRWHQDTPAMQFAHISQSVLGWIDNVRDGTSDPVKASRHIARDAQQITELAPYLVNGSW